MTYKFSFVIAFMDAVLAAILAYNGDTHFVFFAILATLMYLHGAYYRMKYIGE